ncbi:AAA family ATPase [Catenisphaera adipataccumulans]|uniref:Nuclease SbcCD subunit C n=1 Tax=Catenisphaera adipataccumulans TaxID=700500 RepID=A0A7W8CYM3_9FIRM|nr:AAA family ATPase [Catenisphaera adipataccumulans]MBB5182687.1 DNA sulfur modification protein DndD [Catenisphaera adipataccumulans]
MLLKSIKLENFRQFKNESIDFAQGQDGKNVTIILGENGTGKTTFAQAFFWCMYGETAFSDKVMLNKKVAADMTPGEEKLVKVTLCLHHGEVDYKLIRKQVYHKSYSNNIKGDNTVFDIETKDSSGNTSYVKKSQCEFEVKKILPKELSKYFFFDGERIEKMSKDISTGNKSNDFAEAVKGLLGLNGMISALSHFNPRNGYGVIRSYEKSFNSKSNKKIEEYTQIIEKCNKRLEEIKDQIEELDSEIIAAQTRRDERTAEIKQYEEGKKLQEEKEKLQKEIQVIINSRAKVYKAVCETFNVSTYSFFSLSLIKRALELLADHDFGGKDIPFMHQKTVEYLLARKECICGTHLDEGSIPYNKLKELMNYLPPKSLSTTVFDFKREAKTRAGRLKNVHAMIQEDLAIISEQTDEIIDREDELNRIERKLSSKDVQAKVRTIHNEIQLCNETITKSNIARDELNIERGGIEKERKRADSERNNLTILDESNKRTQIYLNYAKRIYEELDNDYKTSELKVRTKLQSTINDIFKQIYEGDLSLNIDEKYHIKVLVNDYEGEVETSTAQSIAVIFAFITAIIKMARENQNNEENKLLSSEPYPLVMDAPLSAFDKRRIKTVCEALPRTAEQVVIFIKDTDGELAEKYMGDKIGSKHLLEKKNEFETILI